MRVKAKLWRGATPTREGGRFLPFSSTSHNSALATCAVITCFLAGTVLQSYGNRANAVAEQIVISSLLPEAVLPVDDLWLVSRPTESEFTLTVDKGQKAVTIETSEPPKEPWVDQVVKSGDNLSLIFQRAGFNLSLIHISEPTRPY